MSKVRVLTDAHYDTLHYTLYILSSKSNSMLPAAAIAVLLVILVVAVVTVVACISSSGSSCKFDSDVSLIHSAGADVCSLLHY
jgi:ABC-type Fe3+ transport system permease subunit